MQGSQSSAKPQQRSKTKRAPKEPSLGLFSSIISIWWWHRCYSRLGVPRRRDDNRIPSAIVPWSHDDGLPISLWYVDWLSVGWGIRGVHGLTVGRRWHYDHGGWDVVMTWSSDHWLPVLLYCTLGATTTATTQTTEEACSTHICKVENWKQ